MTLDPSALKDQNFSKHFFFQFSDSSDPPLNNNFMRSTIGLICCFFLSLSMIKYASIGKFVLKLSELLLYIISSKFYASNNLKFLNYSNLTQYSIIDIAINRYNDQYKFYQINLFGYPTKSTMNNQPLTQRYKSFRSLAAMIIVYALGAFYFGYGIAYFSTIQFTSLMNIFGITWSKNFAQGLLTGCVPIGGGIGALSSDLLIRRFSRRQCVLIINAMAMVLGILIYIQNPYVLIIIRLCQGICVGLYSAITPVIIKQLSPTEISGTMGAFNQFFVAFGVFFSYTFKYILSKIADDENGDHIWIYVFGLPLILVLFQTLMLVLVYPYETPKYLLTHDRDQEARQLISVIYKDEFIDEVFDEKCNDMGKKSVKDSASGSILSSGNEEPSQLSNALLGKVKKNNKIAVFMAIHLAILQQFVGINAVVAYGGEIAGEALPSVKATFPIIINFEQVFTSLVVSYLLSRIGRKSLLQLGCVLGAISTGIISIGFFIKADNSDLGSGLILFGLVVFMANFGISLGPVVWLYIPEVVQPSIVPYSTGANWGAAAAVMLFFPIIKEALPSQDPAPLFLFFSAWCVASFFINAKYCVQTKGKSEKQIREEYNKLLE